MSLFHSAFDSVPMAGPSSRLSSFSGVSKNHKRKRLVSIRDEVQKDDHIRATQRNLQRLMSNIDKGLVKGNADGSEVMGLKTKPGKKKRKIERGKKERLEKTDHPSLSPVPRINNEIHQTFKTAVKSIRDITRGELTEPLGRTQPLQERTQKRQRPSSTKVVDDETVTSKPEPAQLPLPHTLHNPHPVSNAEEGLTSMQKNMKAKLEGARFR